MTGGLWEPSPGQFRVSGNYRDVSIVTGERAGHMGSVARSILAVIDESPVESRFFR